MGSHVGGSAAPSRNRTLASAAVPLRRVPSTTHTRDASLAYSMPLFIKSFLWRLMLGARYYPSLKIPQLGYQISGNGFPQNTT